MGALYSHRRVMQISWPRTMPREMYRQMDRFVGSVVYVDGNVWLNGRR